MPEDNTRIRKVVIVALVLIAIIWMLIWLVSYLTTGSLTVTTDNASDVVSVRPINSPAGGSDTKSAPHSISVRLKPGKYVISAANRTFSAAKVVAVRARHGSTYNLNPLKASSVEPVLPSAATSLAVDSSGLIYVDSLSHSLWRVDASNTSQRLSDMVVRQASLASTGAGVVQDENNKLYAVNNGSITPVDTSGHAVNASLSNISVSPGGRLAFTSGNDVYAGLLGSNYKPIYRLGDTGAKVYSGGDKIAVVEKIKSKGDVEGNSKVTVIDSSGKTTDKEIDVLQAGWSPSGKYLFVATENGNYIYDASLNLVHTLESTPFSAFTWISDSSMAYATGNMLWVYNLDTGTAGQIAKTANNISLVAATPDGSYVYAASEPAGNGITGSLSRVGLKGQSVPDYIQTLNVFLPENVGVCSIGYLNFTKPTITVTYPQATTPPDFCVNAARGELTYYGLNPDKFQFQAAPN